ncbi:MAG TPA: alkaline phosphatase D family protein, partial [bacterium]|nr:alkaline phosphatase D family protein [bacterium]
DVEIPDEDEDEVIDEEPVDYCKMDPLLFDKAQSVDDVYTSVEHDPVNFPMTVQAGSMEHDKVILWGHTEDNLEKTLVIWRNSEETGKIALVKEIALTPVDGYMKLKVEELAPGTWYSYGFFSKDEEGFVNRSLIGKFKTAIHPNCMETITITGTHGTNFKHEYTALKVSQKFNADFFVQLGDFAYNDGSSSTEDFRNKWRKTLAETDYISILPTIGQYIVWDDHEVTDNGDYEPDLKKDLAKVHRGLDVWFEMLPVEKREDVENNWGNPSYYRTFKWGKTLEMFMIDCRAERIPDTRSSDSIYISNKQMSWFKQALLDSTAHFKVIANSVPIAHYGGLWDFAVNDRWEGYKAQRTEILNHIINNNIQNVVWLSGDFHTGSVAPIDDPATPWGKMWEINMGPGGNTNPLGDMGKVPNFLWNTGKMNATVIVFDPFQNSIYVKYLDPDKETVMYETTLFLGTAPLNPLGVYNY